MRVPIPEGGYRLVEAAMFDKPYRALAETLQSSFQGLAFTYEINMNRVVSLTLMLGHLVYLTAQASRALGPLPFERGSAQGDADFHFDNDGASAYNARIDAYVDDAENRGAIGFQYHNRIPSYPGEPSQAFAYGMGMTQIESISIEAGDRGQQINAGIEGVLFSMVLNSYAAFESLAGDLWTAVVDRNPRLALGFDGKSSGKSVTFNDLQKENFEPASKMGTMMRDGNKVDLQRLDKIKEAYGLIFGEVGKELFDANPGLYTTSRVRNLVAHQGGRIDAEFKKFAKDRPEFTGVETDPYLQISGPLVRDLINPCVRTAVNLIRFVDGWERDNGRYASEDYSI